MKRYEIFQYRPGAGFGFKVALKGIDPADLDGIKQKARAMSKLNPKLVYDVYEEDANEPTPPIASYKADKGAAGE